VSADDLAPYLRQQLEEAETHIADCEQQLGSRMLTRTQIHDLNRRLNHWRRRREVVCDVVEALIAPHRPLR
jgi:hypothetical protein